jgi:hypothetical protein
MTPVRKNYCCIHHGSGTRNNRKLSARVERDLNDPKKIISTIKREDTSEYAEKCA